MGKLFRAADVVRHIPSGEQWILACDQEGDSVLPCGWPETLAKARDCELVKRATDERRLDLLREVSADRGGGMSYRRSLAARQLLESIAIKPGPRRKLRIRKPAGEGIR